MHVSFFFALQLFVHCGSLTSGLAQQFFFRLPQIKVILLGVSSDDCIYEMIL